MANPTTSPPNPKHSVGRPWKLLNLQDVEDAVAEVGLKRDHVADWLGCSHDTVQLRLRDDSGFQAAWERGISRYRVKLSLEIAQARGKNAILMLASANQPHILGWTNGKHEVTGRIDHVHSMSPAQMAFLERRVTGKLNVSQNETLSHSDTIKISNDDKKNAETIEK